VKKDRIAELESALRADGGGNALAALILRAIAVPARLGDLCRQLEVFADELAAVAPEPPIVDEAEFERAFDAAEPELAEMITPDSIAEEAALQVDSTPEASSPLASSGAFATRTMAELLERQGDSLGAARIRAALGDAEARDASETDNAVQIAALERWLDNVRRLQP
jgi:hypothetical protein